MRGEPLALAAMLMFASNTIITKMATARLDLGTGFLISVSVNVLFAALLFALQLVIRDDPLRWDGFGFGMFLAAGAFSTYLGRWFFFESVARLGPAKASIFQVSSPFFAAAIAWVFLDERLSPMALLAMAMTLLGLLLVTSGTFGSRSAAASSRPSSGAERLPSRSRSVGVLATLLRSTLLLGLGSSAAYATSNVMRGVAIRHWNEAILGALLGAMAGAGLHLAFNRNAAGVYASLHRADRRGVVLFAVSGSLTILAQLCVIAAMSRSPVAVVTLITLCTPLLVFPLSYFFLRNEERISARTVLGGAITLGGVALLVLA